MYLKFQNFIKLCSVPALSSVISHIEFGRVFAVNGRYILIRSLYVYRLVWIPSGKIQGSGNPGLHMCVLWRSWSLAQSPYRDDDAAAINSEPTDVICCILTFWNSVLVYMDPAILKLAVLNVEPMEHTRSYRTVILCIWSRDAWLL
jgi:hypothetical protein